MSKKRNTAHPVVLALFILYMLGYVVSTRHSEHLAVVTMCGWRSDLGAMVCVCIRAGFNLVPFLGIAEQIGFILAGEDAARNIIYLAGNLMGFAPLGFFFRCCSKTTEFGVFFITRGAGTHLFRTRPALDDAKDPSTSTTLF